MSATNTLEDRILNHFFRNTADTADATLYVALFTAAPGETGGGTEVSGGAYARVVATFGAPSGGQIANNALITYPAASADWGVVTHFAIMTALTGGVMLAYGQLNAPRTILTNDVAEFAVGVLKVLAE